MAAVCTAGDCRSSQSVCSLSVCRSPRWRVQAASPASQKTSAGAVTAAQRSASFPPTASQNAPSIGCQPRTRWT